MDKIKELTDFYMWMQENDYDHNIRIRVEKKAEMYLKTLKQGGKLPIHSVVGQSEQLTCDTCKSGLIDYPEIPRRTCRCGSLGYNVTD